MNTETIVDIVREMRDGSIYDENGGIDLHEIADRIEAAHEHELIVEKAKSAAEGYAAGKEDSYED